MGFAVSWIAVSGKDANQVLNELQLNRTGETEETPESPICSAYLPIGWFLIFVNEFDSSLISDKTLKEISAGCIVISCQIEEHVMFSSAASYSDGSQAWRVEHDAQQSIYHLSSIGATPPQLSEIHNNLKKEQDEAGGTNADVDYIFDIPVTLAKVVTSFRHDEDIQGSNPEPFEILNLRSAPASAKPWWKVW